MRYLTSFFIFSIYLYGFNYHLKPYKISDGIHCFFGLPSQVNHINGGNMVNSCYVETSDSYVIIDSGPTYSYAQEAYKVMQKKKNLPVSYVINTSWEEVHVLGNQFYQERGAKLIGPTGYKKHIEYKNILFLSTKLTKDAFLNTRAVPLDFYIDKEKILIFENMKIKINTLENDGNHLYVHIREKDILFAGDFVFNNRIVPIKHGRSLIRWLRVLDDISILKWSDIISSHGYMTRRSAVKNTKSYLLLLKSEILKGLEEGKSREEIIKSVKLSSFGEDKFYKVWHFKNVARVYDELKNNMEDLELDVDNQPAIEMEKELKHIESVKIKMDKEVKLEKEIVALVKPKVVTKNIKKKILKKVVKVKYKSFSKAMNVAQKKNKIVLIKVRSTICKYCDQLDRIFRINSKVRKILNRYFEVVKINTDYKDIPLDITVRSTPTLIFIRPDNEKVLMKLAGIRALGELLEILNEAVDDGHNDGYLRP